MKLLLVSLSTLILGLILGYGFGTMQTQKLLDFFSVSRDSGELQLRANRLKLLSSQEYEVLKQSYLGELPCLMSSYVEYIDKGIQPMLLVKNDDLNMLFEFVSEKQCGDKVVAKPIWATSGQ